MVAATVVDLPFLQRRIALPVLFRSWRPGGPTEATLARDLIRLIAAARSDRRIHVVADGAYLCKTLRYLPANVTLTGPLPRHATLWDVHPEHARPYVCVGVAGVGVAANGSANPSTSWPACRARR